MSSAMASDDKDWHANRPSSGPRCVRDLQDLVRDASRARCGFLRALARSWARCEQHELLQIGFGARCEKTTSAVRCWAVRCGEVQSAAVGDSQYSDREGGDRVICKDGSLALICVAGAHEGGGGGATLDPEPGC